MKAKKMTEGAELARKMYLKMRMRLIEPTAKIYGALVKAHVRCNEIYVAQAFVEM